jgi:tRNA dimethylallyltransferase
MSIGTAKPTLDEMQGVIHYFIGSHSIHNELTAASYATEANKLLTNLFKTHNNIVLVGGSGMYIDALCSGLHDIPASPELRDVLTEEWKTEGIDKLVSELASCDAITFNQIDIKNPVRVIRALEVFRLTGLPISSFKRAQQATPDFNVIRFVIDLPRNELYDRINRRVDLMIQNGLIDEVRELIPFKQYTSLNTVGYKEILDHLEGNYSLEEAIEKVKLNSRRYAKRQLTWFRRHKESYWIEPKEFNEIVEKYNLS